MKESKKKSYANMGNCTKGGNDRLSVTKECEPKCAEGYEKREKVKTICNLGNNEIYYR